MISELFRKLFGFRNYEEDFQAGVQYAQEQLRKYRGSLMDYHRLWAECDSSGIDASGFDAGMRQVLIMQNIPHPLDFEGTNNATATANDCHCGR